MINQESPFSSSSDSRHRLGEEVKCDSFGDVFEAAPLEDTSTKRDGDISKLEDSLAHGSIFLFGGGETEGPYHYSELKNLWDCGEISEDSAWWMEGMADWRPIQEIFAPSIIKSMSIPFPEHRTSTTPTTIPPDLPTARSLFTILVNEEQSGPFTFGQVKSLWNLGKITVKSQFRTESDLEWRCFQAIVPLIEEPVSAPQRDSIHFESAIPPAQLRVLEIQSKMKSPGIALLWGLILPILGAAYGSLGGAFACFLLTLSTILCLSEVAGKYRQSPSDASIFLTILIFQLLSIFLSLAGVAGHNQSLITNEKGRNKVIT